MTLQRHVSQVSWDGSDELEAIPVSGGRRCVTPTGTVGEHDPMTKDMEVPSQVNSGHPPAAAGPADRLARKDF